MAEKRKIAEKWPQHLGFRVVQRLATSYVASPAHGEDVAEPTGAGTARNGSYDARRSRCHFAKDRNHAEPANAAKLRRVPVTNRVCVTRYSCLRRKAGEADCGYCTLESGISMMRL